MAAALTGSMRDRRQAGVCVALLLGLLAAPLVVGVQPKPKPTPPARPPASKAPDIHLQYPPLRLAVHEDVAPNDQLEGVYLFDGLSADGAPKYKRTHGVGTGSDFQERYLYTDSLVKGRWYVGDTFSQQGPVRLYCDKPADPLVPPGFAGTANEEGWMGEAASSQVKWLKYDGKEWTAMDAALSVAQPVTCGSVVKLQSLGCRSKLHGFPQMTLPKSSFKVVSGYANWDDTPNYEGGSELAGSYWQIVGALDVDSWVAEGYDTCGPESVGKPLKSKALIRLKHVSSQMWLHTGWHAGHQFMSPLSRQQEVALAGNGTGADFDFGDNWMLELVGSNQYWVADSSVQLSHVNTKCYLSMDERYRFPNRNGKLSGQREVACSKAESVLTKWRAAEGIYLPTAMHFDRDEL